MAEVPQESHSYTSQALDYVGTAGPSLSESLWRFRFLVVIGVLVAGGAGYGLSFLQSTTYEAEARMILADPRTAGVFQDSATSITDLSRYVRNQAEFMESATVTTRAIELLPADLELSVKEATDSISVTPSRDLDLVSVSAIQPTARAAAELANAVADAYQELIREQVQSNATSAINELAESRLTLKDRAETLEESLSADPDNVAIQAERDALIAQLVTLDTRIEQITVNMALYGSGVQHFEPADVPTSRATPQPGRNAAAAAVLGLLAAGSYAWLRAERLPLADERHDPAPILGAPLLAEIPEFARAGAESPAPTVFEPTTGASEAYQFLVSSLHFALEQIEGSTVLITSPTQGDGKTATALNMSVAAVGDGTQILLVDADERARGLTLLGGREEALGLTDLAQRDDLQLVDCLQRWKVSDDQELSVVPAGSRLASAGGFFRSAEFRKLMTTLRNAAPIVVFDSPPVLVASEATDIAAQVDGIVVVVTRGTPLRLLEETRIRLEMIGKPLLGYVFNRAVPSRDRYGYGYGYGYGYARRE